MKLGVTTSPQKIKSEFDHFCNFWGFFPPCYTRVVLTFLSKMAGLQKTVYNMCFCCVIGKFVFVFGLIDLSSEDFGLIMYMLIVVGC